MHALALLLLVVLCSVVIFGSRTTAVVGIIAGACLMTVGQMLVVGPFHFHFFRLVILAGLTRITLRGELRTLKWARIDLAVVAWSTILLASSVGHKDRGDAFVFALGIAFSTALPYFLFRALIRSLDDIIAVSRWLISILVVLAAAMIAEKAFGHSSWEMFGAVATSVRNERIRAVGPFRHAILAGSVGAALVPLMLALRYCLPRVAVVGLLACLAIAIASASTGPLVALASGVSAFWVWKYREKRRALVWAGVVALMLLQIVMKDNVWYLMARIDLVGGSTGWHRAYLIDMALKHLGEWWLAGTDYTRHWMPTGVSWSPDHADITNHYIGLGVTGGLALVLAHIWTLARGFKTVGHVLERHPTASPQRRLLVWALGSVLFGHAINSLSIYYFDQSVLLVYFVLACIGSLEAYPQPLDGRSTGVVTGQPSTASSGPWCQTTSGAGPVKSPRPDARHSVRCLGSIASGGAERPKQRFQH